MPDPRACEVTGKERRTLSGVLSDRKSLAGLLGDLDLLTYLLVVLDERY